MNFTNQTQRTKRNPVRNVITKISLYLGIGAAVATILQFTIDVFFSDKPNITATNNSGNNTITQVQLNNGKVFINDLENSNKDNSISQQNKLEVSSSQFIAYSYDLIQQENYELAVNEIPQYIDGNTLDPIDISVLNYNLALAYYHLGQYGTANSILKNVVDTAGFAEAYYFLGVINSTCFENYEEAILNFTKALEYETNTKYLLARAWTYYKNGQLNAASEDYNRILQIDYQNEDALIGINQLILSSEQ